MKYDNTRHMWTKLTILSLLFIAGTVLTPLLAQESCYEQYLREHNMKILTAEDADDSYDELKKTVLAKQMYGDSYLLMVDTVAQRAVITKVDGTYVADVHVALVDSTWYMWLSVDPLADKNPGVSPYIYCNGNPIRFIDPDGREWKDVDGNPIADHTNIKAYIFYNPKEFGSQSLAMAHRLEKKYGLGTVAMSDVITESEFAADWNAMGGKNIQEVNINHHGSNQAIHLDAGSIQYITATGNGTTNRNGNPATNVQDLAAPQGNIKNAQLNLNTCHANDPMQYKLEGRGETLQSVFFKTFEFKIVRGTKAGVSYGSPTASPHPQSNKIGPFTIHSRNFPVWDIMIRQ